MYRFIRESVAALALASPLAAEVVAQEQKSKPQEPVPVALNTGNPSEAKELKAKESLLKLTYFAVEFFGLGHYQEISPEYAWASRDGKWKGFGLDEVRVNSKTNFTNHNISYQPMGKLPVSVLVEGGLVGKEGFAAAGVKVGLEQIIPTVDKVFDSAGVAFLQKVYGVAPGQQVLLTWDTKPLHLGKLEIDSQGFYRVKQDANYGQPQAFLTIKGHEKCHFGVQLDVYGGHVQASVGMKIDIK